MSLLRYYEDGHVPESGDVDPRSQIVKRAERRRNSDWQHERQRGSQRSADRIGLRVLTQIQNSLLCRDFSQDRPQRVRCVYDGSKDALPH